MKSSLRHTLIWMAVLLTAGLGLTAAADVIQTQESDSWDGMEADLVGVSVRNDILTLKFKFRNTGGDLQDVQFLYKDCYIVDDSNQKKYFMLKDSEGQFLGGPKDKEWEGGRFGHRIAEGGTKGCWMKFPVPADGPDTISVSIPGFFPFEEVSLQ